MDDINLLPTDQSKTERQEAKKKALEKSKVSIELTSPEKKVKEEKLPKKTAKFWSGFSQKVKDLGNKIKKPAKSESSRPAQSIKHFDAVKSKEPNKKFHYQAKRTEEQKNIRTEEQKSRETEEKKNIKPMPFIRPAVQSPKQEPSQETTSLLSSKAKTSETAKSSKTPKFSPPKLDINLIPSRFKLAINLKQQLMVLIIVVVVCVLISIAAYLGLDIMIAIRQSEINGIEAETELVMQRIRNLKRTNQEVTEFTNLLKEAKGLIEEHIFATQVFDFLQAHTLKQVYYNDLQVEVDNLNLALTGNAKDYQTLAQQLLYFQSLDEIVNIELSGVQLEEGEEGEESFVTFNLTLTMQPEFFYKK